MSTNGRYVPDPELVDGRGYDYGKEANDCGFDEAEAKPGSEEELQLFAILAGTKLNPAELNDPSERARYAAYLKEKGIKL